MLDASWDSSGIPTVGKKQYWKIKSYNILFELEI